jgi:hypothetical protein
VGIDRFCCGNGDLLISLIPQGLQFSIQLAGAITRAITHKYKCSIRSDRLFFSNQKKQETTPWEKEINSSELPRGIYFCRNKNRDRSWSRKMVISE